MNSIPAASENRLLSERHKAFQDALETLYIKSNASGRLKFAADWPDIALHIFGDELLRADRDGLKDKTRRAALEQEAEDRRLKLLDLCANLERNSAANGALNVNFAQGVVNNLGRGASLYLYSSWIVDKFLPPPAAPAPVIKTPAPQARAPRPLEETLERHNFSMPEAPAAPALLPTLQPTAPTGLDMETIRPISLAPQLETPAASAMEKQEEAPPQQKTRLKLFGIKDAPPGDAET